MKLSIVEYNRWREYSAAGYGAETAIHAATTNGRVILELTDAFAGCHDPADLAKLGAEAGKAIEATKASKAELERARKLVEGAYEQALVILNEAKGVGAAAAGQLDELLERLRTLPVIIDGLTVEQIKAKLSESKRAVEA